MRALRALVICILGSIPTNEAFCPGGTPSSHHHCELVQPGCSAPLLAHNLKDDHFLLEEYKIHNGEVINPYKVLKVSRDADRFEIKQAYRKLSRRYHPDGYRNRRQDILPGSCNSWEEVRDHWERIKLAYEILSDPKSRKRYDRHEALADPGAAIQRAAVNAAFSGFKGVGHGLFSIGTFAFEQMKKTKQEAKSHENQVGRDMETN